MSDLAASKVKELKSWKMIYRHNHENAPLPACDEMDTPDLYNDIDHFSKLFQLENYKRSDNKFHFRMCYPGACFILEEKNEG